MSELFSTCKDAQSTDWFDEGSGHSMMLDRIRRVEGEGDTLLLSRSYTICAVTQDYIIQAE